MAEPRLTPLPAAGFRRTPWKNGGGITIDIADAYGPDVAPGSWQGMIWRLGRTTIAAPGPFSDLTGYDRLQTVISGQGLVLETPDGEIDLRRPFQVVRYDGGMPIVSRLEHGPVEVVNLIADRERCEIALAVVAAPAQHMLRPALHVLYAATGTVAGLIGGEPVAIEAGAALRIDATATTLMVKSGIAIVATIGVRA
jgi:hypothetical protein